MKKRMSLITEISNMAEVAYAGTRGGCHMTSKVNSRS
jgi:hypothetical protein